jgi:LacI family transcriptional regulator
MAKKTVTIKDIARKLNLHYTTISKALKDHPGISSATKTLVRKTAADMDYFPSAPARSLKHRKSRMIGVIVPAISNDFFSTVISGIEEVAYREEYSIIVSQSHENVEREQLNIRHLLSHMVAGLAVCISQTTRSGSHFQRVLSRGIPLVFFDRVCADVDAGKVISDDLLGAREVVEHLIASGYRDIAHLAGPAAISVSDLRCRGYLQSLRRHGMPADEAKIVHGGFEEHDGSAGFKRIWRRKRRPDAVFAVNDLVAAGAYLEIRSLGLRIPEDIALAGFGNNRISSYLDPPLTTVQQSPIEMGKKTAEILLERIEGKDGAATPRTEILKPRLIIRGST